MSEHGWFSYGRHPTGKVGEWTITRDPDDPPITVWRVDETTWIVDDAAADQHVQLSGFTEVDIRASLTFAKAMGWIDPGTEPSLRQLVTGA